MVESKITQCPKCKSENIDFVEVWEGHSIVWNSEGGKFNRKDGVLHEGNPKYVSLSCRKCKYINKIRKAYQIDDIL